MARKFTAEALGTALLVFFGVGVATLMFGFGFDGGVVAAGVVATALAFGLVQLALAYAIGPLTGCHINPAVTLGALLAGRLPAREALGYWAAQFAGGILGALLLWGMFNTSPLYSTSRTGLGADGWGAASDIHIGAGGAFLAEVVLTAMFVFVILAVTSKIGNPATAGTVIGLALTVAHLIGIPITGTSVNPARSLGPALIVGGTALNQVWLFIVAPLIGGAAAAGLHYLVFSKPRPSAKATRGHTARYVPLSRYVAARRRPQPALSMILGQKDRISGPMTQDHARRPFGKPFGARKPHGHHGRGQSLRLPRAASRHADAEGA